MKQIEEGTGGRQIQGTSQAVVGEICTDSRRAKAGDLFFALIGDRHDAHKYLGQVIQAGCTDLLICDQAALEETEGGDQAMKRARQRMWSRR